MRRISQTFAVLRPRDFFQDKITLFVTNKDAKDFNQHNTEKLRQRAANIPSIYNCSIENKQVRNFRMDLTYF